MTNQSKTRVYLHSVLIHRKNSLHLKNHRIQILLLIASLSKTFLKNKWFLTGVFLHSITEISQPKHHKH